MGRSAEFYDTSYGVEMTEPTKQRKRGWFGGYFADGLPYGNIGWTPYSDGVISVSDPGGEGGPGGDGSGAGV